MNTLTIATEAARFNAAERVRTDRVLEFYAAAFSDTPDSHGDVIDPKAFDAWLPEFYAKGQALPISFNHAAALDPLDPTNVVGYAPAAPSNVWVDDYGLRVKAYLDVTTEKGKAIEYQVESGLLKGASLAYAIEPADRVKRGDHYVITRVRSVRETGLVPNPANQDAVLLWMKAEGMTAAETDLPYMTVDEFRTILLKAVDESTWDGNRAMGMCDTAAEYRSICAAEHTTGEPDQRQHWALPHHYLGRGPNAAGVRAALSRVDQTQEITDAERAAGRRHLEAHMREINPATASAEEAPSDQAQYEAALETLTKHAASPQYLQAAHDALCKAGAKCAGIEDAVTAAKAELVAASEDVVAQRLRHLRAIQLGTY